MKKKLSKIFGIGLSLVLALALAGPLMADVTEPTVSIPRGDNDISDTGITYTITFQITEDLVANDYIYIRFPDDTDVSAVGDTDITITVTSGIGSSAGEITETDGLTVVVDDQDVEIELLDLTDTGGLIGRLADVEVQVAAVDNPPEAGDYTLFVMTSVLGDDDWVESEVYEIVVPTVGGGVTVYNESGVLVDFFGGEDALKDCDDWGQEDYTIEVGPGNYVITTAAVTISGLGLTLVSTDGADVTIVDGNTFGFVIGAAEVTIDGFTIEDAGTAVSIGAFDDAVIQNNVIIDATTAVAIASGGADATVSDNVIEDCATGIAFGDGASDATVENNEITGADTLGAIVFTNNNDDNTIIGNTITDNDIHGIYFDDGGGSSSDGNVIEENTISTNDGHGIFIDADQAPTGLVIQGNVIEENDDDGIYITEWAVTNVVVFNNITGFAGPGNFGLDNDSTVDVDAAFNWWGSDDEDDVRDAINDPAGPPDFGTVTYEPWLSDVAGAIFTGYNAAGDIDELDAEDEAGVVVNTEDTDGDAIEADRIKAGAYAANPEGEDPRDPAVAYYDVYVNDGTAGDAVQADIKLYVSGINDDMVAYMWGLATDQWVNCADTYDVTVSEFGGFILVEDVVLADLGGTTFAVVQGPPADVNVPDLEAPDYGAEDVGLNPTFAWGGVADADEYTLQVATNQFYVDAWEKVHLTHTVWRWDIALDYDTTYYWRVQAIEDSGESDWAESVFTTEAAPVTPPAPPAVLYTCPTCGLSFDTPSELQAHWEAIHAPPPPPAPEPLPTTPAYIWVIIAVGAVLIIAVIALIIRTRRVV